MDRGTLVDRAEIKDRATRLSRVTLDAAEVLAILADGDRVARMQTALLQIIAMTRQTAKDQIGDPAAAESWSCVVVARAALARGPT